MWAEWTNRYEPPRSSMLARIDIGQSKRTYSTRRNIITRPNEFDQFPTLHKPSPPEDDADRSCGEKRDSALKRNARVIDDSERRAAPRRSRRSAGVLNEQMQIHCLMRTDGFHMDLHTQLRFSSRMELSWSISVLCTPLWCDNRAVTSNKFSCHDHNCS